MNEVCYERGLFMSMVCYERGLL